MIRALVFAVLLLFAGGAQAKDLLVSDGGNYRLVLTDEPCSEAVKKLVAEGWPFPVARARVELTTDGARKHYGKDALEACYSVTPMGVTVVDEANGGTGPGEGIPPSEFHEPGKPGKPAKGQTET